jgi:tetratricopeptide (TPR) repeat protein
LTENKIQEKNWQEVLNLSKKLVKILPNSFKGHFYLANSLFTLGNLDEAIEEYKESLKISKDNLSALTNLGFTYIKKNDLKNAKETFEKILQIDPQNKTAQEQLNLLRSMNPTTTYW